MAVPFLSNDEIESQAESFLDRYLIERSIPIPIEDIVEADLKIEIIPIPGFRDRFNIEGYLSNDLSTLLVDSNTMQKYPARYRFTLAHEIGHYLLHGDFIRSEFPESTMDWKQKLLARDPKLHTRLETQANRMAGAILVPRRELQVAWEDAAFLRLSAALTWTIWMNLASAIWRRE